jgi:hypothetical protein
MQRIMVFVVAMLLVLAMGAAAGPVELIGPPVIPGRELIGPPVLVVVRIITLLVIGGR